MAADDLTRDRAKRLYQFVRGLIELRRVPTRRYGSEDVIWLADLPEKPDCAFAPRGDFSEEGDERWLEVKCPKIERFPDPPAILRDWFEPSELADATLDIPTLLLGARISEEVDDVAEEEWEEEEGESILRPLDMETDEPPPEVKDAWEKYVADSWLPWKRGRHPSLGRSGSMRTCSGCSSASSNWQKHMRL